ncbi:hypothetical protein LP420_34585 [Massilia sp. B-10]|nr:hypothetical protein LP420_34585 [Massilia sp. B-10]
MELLGKMMNNCIQGTIDLLALRSLVKQEVKADVTVVVLRNNNPMKFFPDSQTVLTQMLRKKMPGFMEPLEAIDDANRDLQGHQKGVVARHQGQHGQGDPPPAPRAHRIGPQDQCAAFGHPVPAQSCAVGSVPPAAPLRRGRIARPVQDPVRPRFPRGLREGSKTASWDTTMVDQVPVDLSWTRINEIGKRPTNQDTVGEAFADPLACFVVADGARRPRRRRDRFQGRGRLGPDPFPPESGVRLGSAARLCRQRQQRRRQAQEARAAPGRHEHHGCRPADRPRAARPCGPTWATPAFTCSATPVCTR